MCWLVCNCLLLAWAHPSLVFALVVVVVVVCRSDGFWLVAIEAGDWYCI